MAKLISLKRDKHLMDLFFLSLSLLFPLLICPSLLSFSHLHLLAIESLIMNSFSVVARRKRRREKLIWLDIKANRLPLLLSISLPPTRTHRQSPIVLWQRRQCALLATPRSMQRFCFCPRAAIWRAALLLFMPCQPLGGRGSAFIGMFWAC